MLIAGVIYLLCHLHGCYSVLQLCSSVAFPFGASYSKRGCIRSCDKCCNIAFLVLETPEVSIRLDCVVPEQIRYDIIQVGQYY